MAPLSDIFKFMGNSTIIKRLLSMQIATPTNYKNTEFANSLPIEPIDPRVIKAFYTFLLKKLINPSETLLELEKVLMGKYSTKSPCILYKRESLDGKIVVNGLLLSPFFVSCKIWQWPLLVTEKEIDPIRTCSNSHFKSSADVCINPYHYEKIKISTLTVHVPKKSNATNKIIESNDSFNPYVPTLHHQSNINVDDNPIHLKKHTFSQSSDQNQQVDQFNLNHFSSPITFDEPMYWCSISYYEYSERVGETFQASLPAFDVDGFTYPSNAQRFCLGLLSNINRQDNIEYVRKHIGRGIRLYYVGGEVFAECVGNNSIFIQLPNFPWTRQTVCKIPPGNQIKIFNNREFASILSECINQGFEAAYKLTQMCTIRLSFVKGWGSNYRRQFITEMPCWLEIQLNGPLRWLDKVLMQMGSPTLPCSSVS